MITLPAGAPSVPGEGSRRHLLFGLTGFTVVLLVGVLFVPSLILPMPVAQSGLVPSASIPPWNNWTCNPNNPSPAALNIPVANPSVNQTAGTTFNITYEFEVEGYVASDSGTILYLPTTAAVFPTVSTGTLRMTIPEENVTITGPGWSSPTLLSATTKLTSNENFSGASAYLTTGKYAVMANAVSGSLTLEFRWQWNFSSATGGTNETGSWSVPSLTATSPYLPSIFYPAPYVGIVSTTASPAVAGTIFNLELNGTVASTSFRMVLEYPNNGTEIQSIWENTSAHATLFNATVPLSYRSGAPLPAGNYWIHVHDVCEAIVQMHFVVVTVEKTFNVTFTESGLPSDTTWYVNITELKSYSSTESTISFSEPNGTYDYTVATADKEYAPTPSGGSFEVRGTSVGKSVTFNLTTYTVTFAETGPPPGTSWSVTLGGTQHTSTTNTTTFTEPNGTYSYAITDISGWHQTTLPYTGNVKVSGAAVTEPTLVFTQVTYSVTFTESGLPSGTEWWVNLTDEQSFSSTATSLSFSEPNGTYNYTVATADKEYAPTPSGGSFEVLGTSVGKSVTFNLATYTVTFTETGLPSGTTWYVNGTAWGTLSATVAGTLGTAVSANLANGTYSFTVTSANKTWAPAYTSPFIVNGAPVAVPVTFAEVTYAVTFTESGLPSGTTWYVNLTDGQSNSSTGTTIGFLEPNGSYSYTVATADKEYSPTLSGGSFEVRGTSVGKSATFNLVTYTVTFTESGLPSGTTWYVNITHGQSNSSTGSRIRFSEPNGTYDYTVATADREYAPVLVGGSFKVSGASVSESVTFSRATYTVTFTETGLPSGTTWYVNGTTWGSLSATVAGTLGTSTSVNLTNGTYPFTVASANKTWAPAYTSPFVVKGGPVAVPVTFTEVTYAVIFTETGLPSGTHWSVTLNGNQHTSTTTTITFTEPNGNYSYAIADISGWHQTTLPYTGEVQVKGAAVTEPTLVFTQVTYSVTFTESGLPSGTEWWVNLTGGQTFSSTTDSLSFAEPNGTYNYTVATADKEYAPVLAGGSSGVSGATASESVTFRLVTYTVTFSETGLPSGTEWWVNLTNGQSFSSTGTTLTISEANGTYSYSASAPEHTNTTGVLTVSGPTAAPVVVSFSSSSSSSSSFPILDYVIIGVVIVAVAIGLVVVLMRRRGKAPPGPARSPSRP
jgi:lipocalin